MIYGNNVLNDINILNEIKIYSNDNENFSITVDGSGDTDRGYYNDPYFKFHNNKNAGIADKTVRIGINGGAHYIVHDGDNRTLNLKERKALSKSMNSIIYDKDKKKDITMWEKVINSMIKVSRQYTDDPKILNKIKNTPMPDFMNIAPAKK